MIRKVEGWYFCEMCGKPFYPSDKRKKRLCGSWDCGLMYCLKLEAAKKKKGGILK